MKETKNLKLKMPEKNEYINIADINENAEKIDEELGKKADASGGDISETVITTAAESQDEYPVPAAGDSAKTVLGKVQKFFADIRNWMTGVCLLGQIVNNCVTDNAKLPLSAAQGKVLMDLYNVLNTNEQKYRVKRKEFSSETDEYSQINLDISGTILFATSARYLLIPQTNGSFRVFGGLAYSKLEKVSQGTVISGNVFYL